MNEIQGISQEEKEEMEEMEQFFKKTKLVIQNLDFNKGNEEIITVLLTLLEALSLIAEKQEVIIDDLEFMRSNSDILINNLEITVDSKQNIINSLEAMIVEIQNDQQKATRSTLTEAKKQYQEFIATCNAGLSRVIK